MHSLVLPSSSNHARAAAPPRASKRTATQKNGPNDKEEGKGPSGFGGGDGGDVGGNEVESNEVTREMKLDFVIKIKKLTN